MNPYQQMVEALRDLRDATTEAYKAGHIPAEPFVRAGNVLAEAGWWMDVEGAAQDVGIPPDGYVWAFTADKPADSADRPAILLIKREPEGGTS